MKNFSLKLDRLKNLTPAESHATRGGDGKVSVAPGGDPEDGKGATQLACPSAGRP